MAAPVLNTTTSVLGYKQFESWSYQPFATGAVKATGGWASSTLPAGMTLSADSGLLSGACTAAGVYVVGITATNASNETSTPLTLTIGIEAASGASATTALELSYDVSTGTVTGTAGGAIPPAKFGDTLLVHLYFKKGSLFVDPGDLDALSIALKAADTDTAPAAASTDWEKVDSTLPYYFRLILPFTGTALAAALADYEPSGTGGSVETTFNALAEISFTKEETVNAVATDCVVTSRNFRWPIYQEID